MKNFWKRGVHINRHVQKANEDVSVKLRRKRQGHRNQFYVLTLEHPTGTVPKKKMFERGRENFFKGC